MQTEIIAELGKPCWLVSKKF